MLLNFLVLNYRVITSYPDFRDIECDILSPINGCGLLDLKELHQFALSTTVPHNQYSYPFRFGDTFDLSINSSNHISDNNLSVELIPRMKNNMYTNLCFLVRFHSTLKRCGVFRSRANDLRYAEPYKKPRAYYDNAQLRTVTEALGNDINGYKVYMQNREYT